jgi:hypothetical protein
MVELKKGGLAMLAPLEAMVPEGGQGMHIERVVDSIHRVLAESGSLGDS